VTGREVVRLAAIPLGLALLLPHPGLAAPAKKTAAKATAAASNPPVMPWAA